MARRVLADRAAWHVVLLRLAFAQVVDSMLTQHAKWLEQCRDFPWRRPLASLNVLLTSHAWRNDHNGFSHQATGFVDNALARRSETIRVYYPPDSNCLLSVFDHCLRSRNYVNIVTCGKQPQLQWLRRRTRLSSTAREVHRPGSLRPTTEVENRTLYWLARGMYQPLRYARHHGFCRSMFLASRCVLSMWWI